MPTRRGPPVATAAKPNSQVVEASSAPAVSCPAPQRDARLRGASSEPQFSSAGGRSDFACDRAGGGLTLGMDDKWAQMCQAAGSLETLLLELSSLLLLLALALAPRFCRYAHRIVTRELPTSGYMEFLLPGPPAPQRHEDVLPMPLVLLSAGGLAEGFFQYSRSRLSTTSS